MRVSGWVVAVSGATLLALAGCAISCDAPKGSASFNGARKAAIQGEVREFAESVARDVTEKGPVGWQKHLADDPAFFLASDGKMQFPNRQTAREGIEEFTRTIPHVELNWGDDLRVDPLTADLAQMAASWHEVLVDNSGHRAEETGFFTGLVEKREGQWQFRNAHWSEVVPTKTP